MAQYTYTCFNTASVLIQLRHLPISSPTFLVSIQLLFLFNPLIQKNYLIGFSFNTASVLIQQSIYIEIYPILDSFNTASVLIQRNKYSIKIQFIVVSIQLLFLFNKYGMKFYKVDCEFQYSFCSYST